MSVLKDKEMSEFELVSDLEPCGDQPGAVEDLVNGVRKGLRHMVLLGVTGSGKTFTMAHTIARVQKPALIIAPTRPWQPALR